MYSEDPNIKRNNGEVGWFPYGVVRDLDYLFFGLDSNGNRVLPVRELSPIQYDQEDQSNIRRDAKVQSVEMQPVNIRVKIEIMSCHRCSPPSALFSI